MMMMKILRDISYLAPASPGEVDNPGELTLLKLFGNMVIIFMLILVIFIISIAALDDDDDAPGFGEHLHDITSIIMFWMLMKTNLAASLL